MGAQKEHFPHLKLLLFHIKSYTVEVQPNFSEAPHLRCFKNRPKTEFRKQKYKSTLKPTKNPMA